MKADLHPREAERLRLLRSYEILDTARGPEFDDVVALASQICAAPISTVTLIDADRQWYHAEIGLGTRQNPLNTAFCSHAILQGDFFEIPDMQTDPRTADNPFVAGSPGVRFYAGAVLRGEDGLPLGTLCVIDFQPRSLTPLQRETLRVLSRQVMAQLDLRRALRRAEVLRREVDHRVKNSLQALSTLARLQARRSNNPAVTEALDQIQLRIQGVATLHEQLYQTDAGGQIPLADYLTNVAKYLQATAPANVALVVQADPVTISSKQAALIGTLFNEFAANAIKHAFPDGRSGTIAISVRTKDDGTAVLVMTDDGIGLPVVAPPRQGLGMTILSTVGRQLGSDIDIGPGIGGMRIAVTFKPDI